MSEEIFLSDSVNISVFSDDLELYCSELIFPKWLLLEQKAIDSSEIIPQKKIFILFDSYVVASTLNEAGILYLINVDFPGIYDELYEILEQTPPPATNQIIVDYFTREFFEGCSNIIHDVIS